VDQRFILQPHLQLPIVGPELHHAHRKGRGHAGLKLKYALSDVAWYELPDYEVEGIRRKLFCRQATSADTKKRECHGHNSQYYQWMINKQKLNNYVKKKASHEIMKTKGINR